MKKKVIVIGAGVGGLSIAARLLFKGFDVEILEKNHTIGGKTNISRCGDFKFDLTASIPIFYQDYIDIFNFCKKDYKEYFSFIELDTIYRCFYSDKSYYDFSNNFSALTSSVNKIVENNVDDQIGFYNFLSSNYNKYLIANKNFLNRGFYTTTSFLNPKLLFNGLKLRTTTSSIANCKKYITNKKLINYLMFQTMYIGVSPYDSPNIYNSIPASSQLEGLHYIKGGMYSYIQGLQKLILEYGGKISTLSNVEKILFNNNKAIGVIANGKTSVADIVICSSDYSYSVNNLIKDINIKDKIKPIENMKHSCSIFILYLAVNKKYPMLKVNNIFINESFKKNIKAPFKGDLPLSPSLYIYCPSSIDPSVCPDKYEVINVLVRVPNLLSKKIKWGMSTINKLKHMILDTLSSIESLEDIKEHVVYDCYLTPLDLRDRFNSFQGCAFGLSHSINQSIIFRPQCTIPKVENLYFTGASIHPGNGVSTVLKSSKICCDRICRDYSLNKKNKC